MIVIEKASDLIAFLKEKRQDKKVGFVPTMGALHEGHLQLVKQAVAENDVSIVSIFVNPTQFNDLTDLEKYPRTIEQDLAKLKPLNVDCVFTPATEEIYPKPDNRKFEFGELEIVMEGLHRPGHFNGVAQVVSKLFDLVKPTNAYFGEKDFQQLAIIKELVKKLGFPINIIPVPIVREQSGLAMSSRNERLTPSQRINASEISKALMQAKAMYARGTSVNNIKQYIEDLINSNDDLVAEYVEIVDGNTLQEIKLNEKNSNIVLCVAVHCGDIRLIDNIRLA